ncbi:hypothetical protein [Candidatus Nephthysia bennettiae]|uniref:Uncharacterized protein n=1 Tax=Candidatus Nephthysia bennettiae TaxID=3127016 RepID=A0A934K6H1_9BACT|nr:hypothetical protein [Candidatus Dormibacteraeota bacterium]MBJ7612764.1 hypothetical protein [Candidatus Dormibacteraeota bacterium]
MRPSRDRREHPGIPESMLVVSFPGGGHLSIEFTDDAPDDDQPRLGAPGGQVFTIAPVRS